MTHKAQGFTLDDYPNVKRWYVEVRARPQCRRDSLSEIVKERSTRSAAKHVRAGRKAAGGRNEAVIARGSDEAIHTFSSDRWIASLRSQ